MGIITYVALIVVLLQVAGTYGQFFGVTHQRDGGVLEDCDLSFGLVQRGYSIFPLILGGIVLFLFLLPLLLMTGIRLLLAPIKIIRHLTTPLLLLLHFIGSKSFILGPLIRTLIETFWDLNVESQTPPFIFGILHRILDVMKFVITVPYHIMRIVIKLPVTIMKTPWNVVSFMIHFPIAVVSLLIKGLSGILRIPIQIVWQVILAIRTVFTFVTLPLRAFLLILARIPPFSIVVNVLDLIRYLVYQLICRLIQTVIVIFRFAVTIPIVLIHLPLHFVRDLISLPVRIIRMPFIMMRNVILLVFGIVTFPIRLIAHVLKFFVHLLFNTIEMFLIRPLTTVLRPFMWPILLVFRIARSIFAICLLPVNSFLSYVWDLIS